MKIRPGLWWLPVVVAIVSISAVGCRGARSESKQAARERRMKEYLDWYASYDATGAERMKRLKHLSDEQRALHRVQLDEMLERIDKHHEHDKKRWNDTEAQRKAWVKVLRDGRPARIEPTWGTMVHREITRSDSPARVQADADNR